MPKKLMILICIWVVIQRWTSLMNKNIGWKGIPQRSTKFASYKYRNDIKIRLLHAITLHSYP